MASTITNLINTIDTGFPVAGQNNDSQGFRTNFSIIQSALLNTEAEIESIQSTLGISAGQTTNVNTNFVTGTHITALTDLNVGGTNLISTGNNYSTVISASGGAGNIAMFVNTASTIILDYQASNATTATSLYLLSTTNVLNSATFTINSNNYKIKSIGESNEVTVTPWPIIADIATVISAQTPITFTNPFIPGQTSVNDIINQALGNGGGGGGVNFANPVTITNTTQAVSSSTGALIVDGGVGIAKNLGVGGAMGVWGEALFQGPAVFNGTLTGGGFANSLATNGYQKLPGGLIMQWGTVTASNDATTVTFPTPFPTQCFGVFPTQYTEDSGSNVNLQADAYRGAGPVSTFTLYARGTERAQPLGWFAIGY